MTISFFDSGLGGITVLAEAIKQLPNEQFLFYADTLHVPYGTKTEQEVMQHVQAAMDDIMQQNVKALVIACNTATSIAIKPLREKYKIPIIGIEPAVKPAVKMNQMTGKRVLVLATPLTLSQTKYNDLVTKIDQDHIVDKLPLPELVAYCEQMNFSGYQIKNYFQHKLQHIPIDQYGTIVLGCTHYLYYKTILRNIFPKHIEIIDGSKGTVQRLLAIWEKNLVSPCSTSEPQIQFVCSDGDSAYLAKMKRALDFYQQYQDINLTYDKVEEALIGWNVMK